MNILIIPTNDWVRAPGHGHIDYIAESLAQKGHRVYAWNFDLYRNQPAKRIPKKVVLIHSRTLPLRDPASFFALNALFQAPAMLRAARKLDVDVVVNENIFSGLIGFLTSKKSVLKVFDFSDYYPEAASVYYEDSHVVGKLVEAITLAITKLNIKTSSICLAVCRSLANNVRSVDRQKPCYLVRNSVDTAKHQPGTSELTSFDTPTLVVMGVIDNWLDLATPIHAVKRLIATYPNLRLLIIGPWRNEEFKSTIESLIEKSGLTKNVVIKGYITDRELTKYLDGASVCIMPYRTDFYSAAIRLPEKLMVYSAHGKPILSTPLPEVKALGTKHVKFYKNAEDLAMKTASLLTDTALRKKMASDARIFAQRHDVNVLAGQLEKILVFSLQEQRD